MAGGPPTVSFALAAPLPFVDIDDTSTLVALGPQLHGELASLGVDELDRGSVYSANRRLTRVLASWIYSRTDDDGQPRYGGIRYESRLGRQWECGASFDGALLTTSTTSPIDRQHPHLAAIADQFGLTPPLTAMSTAPRKAASPAVSARCRTRPRARRGVLLGRSNAEEPVAAHCTC